MSTTNDMYRCMRDNQLVETRNCASLTNTETHNRTSLTNTETHNRASLRENNI
jgi:hypothetical protein